MAVPHAHAAGACGARSLVCNPHRCAFIPQLKGAVVAVKTCTELRQALLVVLKAGNILNRWTPRVSAGFSVIDLYKLRDLKTTDNKQSLMEVSPALRVRPSFVGPGRSPMAIPTAVPEPPDAPAAACHSEGLVTAGVTSIWTRLSDGKGTIRRRCRCQGYGWAAIAWRPSRAPNPLPLAPPPLSSVASMPRQ